MSEAGDVVADERARDGDPGQQPVDLVVHQVQLDQRRTAHPVDEREHAAAAELVVVEDRLDQQLRDLGGGATGTRTRPGSPWIPMPTSISLAIRYLVEQHHLLLPRKTSASTTFAPASPELTELRASPSVAPRRTEPPLNRNWRPMPPRSR